MSLFFRSRLARTVAVYDTVHSLDCPTLACCAIAVPTRLDAGMCGVVRIKLIVSVGHRYFDQSHLKLISQLIVHACRQGPQMWII